jgi:glycosyltransferase involved in cell wall biosynthesis
VEGFRETPVVQQTMWIRGRLRPKQIRFRYPAVTVASMVEESMRYPVHWVSHSASPYNAYLFRALAADPAVDLTVHFMHGQVAGHPWRTPLTVGYRSHVCSRAGGICWDLVRLATTNQRSLLVTGNWSDPTMLLSLTLLAARGRPFVMWTDAPHMAKKRNPIKAHLRQAWLRCMFARAARVMGTGAPALTGLAQMGCGREKLVNFPYFVPLDPLTKFAGSSREACETRPLKFVSVGTVINSIKGHDVAVAAIAKARDLTGRNNFEYRIAGSGVDLDALRRQVHQLGLNDRVTFLGWLEPEQVEDLYHDSDILIHPSRKDAFSAAVLEAMAAGLVVLGSEATAAVRDRIRHGENGFIHRTGDVDELASQIAHLLQHPGTIHPLGCQARRTAEEWPVERGVEIVKSLLAERTVSGKDL